MANGADSVDDSTVLHNLFDDDDNDYLLACWHGEHTNGTNYRMKSVICWASERRESISKSVHQGGGKRHSQTQMRMGTCHASRVPASKFNIFGGIHIRAHRIWLLSTRMIIIITVITLCFICRAIIELICQLITEGTARITFDLAQ